MIGDLGHHILGKAIVCGFDVDFVLVYLLGWIAFAPPMACMYLCNLEVT